MVIATPKTIILVAVGSLILSGCSIPYIYEPAPKVYAQTDAFIYKGINFGENRDVDYQQGVKHGCSTAGGSYTKDHNSFNTSPSYRTGWEAGRLKCKGKK